ncbi:MAG: alpha/beta fold hydrolase BchO [Hyphomicrobium sp.]
MADRLSWDRDGDDWPNRSASRFVTVGAFTWHVQQMGQGPPLLLLHGTGASTHSWRGLMPLLAASHTVIAPDLPGHAFTNRPSADAMSLPGMAAAIGQLMSSLDVRPEVVVGHSAGAAVLLRMCLDRHIAPSALISLNGALLPFQGMAGQIFAPLAKLLVLNPFAASFFAWRAGDRRAVERLLKGTGSRIDGVGLDLYARLFRNAEHVAATLEMMARWDLHGLERDMTRLATRTLLVACDGDLAIPPGVALRTAKLVSSASVERIGGLGHLAHEENPALVAEMIERFIRAPSSPYARSEPRRAN